MNWEQQVLRDIDSGFCAVVNLLHEKKFHCGAEEEFMSGVISAFPLHLYPWWCGHPPRDYC